MIRFLKIVSYLGKNAPKGYTMHELSNLTDIPYASFYRYVKHLAEQNMLLVETVGKSKVVRLNLSYPAQKTNLAYASSNEMLEYLKENPIIKKISNELKTNDIVLLFGSYAKGTQTKNSDVDILVINKDGKKSLDFSKYELIHRKKINTIFIRETEFKSMLQDYEENVGKQALKNHILLNNPDRFWELVLDAIR